ncbi:hypothetical protein OS493_035909 [Desmophyllum pertusum]|uniref:Uncharacterized protein n=1 Tax=Desmophyllum pertusum TaxID=174260 RepID=A0A9W9Z6N3_9CNID|nr:hypothetical protein OS493_035909 [Desmophyllum pertusum]
MYQNELDILRKLVPDQGEATSSISDIIKDYEDKLEGVADENKTLKDELGELQEKIGHGLFNDIQQLQRKAEATESVSEAGENGDKSAMKMESTLKAPDIMNETNLPLEDIVATYEQDLYNLERENIVYKDGLGNGQAEALLQMAQDRDNYSSGEFETQESDTKGVDNGDLEAISKSNEGLPGKPTGQNIDTIAIIRGTYSKYKRQPSQNDVDDEAKADVGTGPDELKAMSLLRDEGQDLEKILKTYEKELEALRKLTPDETEDGMSISDLIKDYENKIEKLESENRIFTQKLDNLVETIGQDLYGALDNLQPEETEDDAKDYSSDKEIDINAVNVMKNEDRSLENVVKNYEKELNALRKLVPGGEGDSGSISDVIKEYEDKVEELQRRNQDLKNTLDQLEEKIGSNLFNDLCTERDEVGSVSDNVASKGKSRGQKIQKSRQVQK